METQTINIKKNQSDFFKHYTLQLCRPKTVLIQNPKQIEEKDDNGSLMGTNSGEDIHITLHQTNTPWHYPYCDGFYIHQQNESVLVEAPKVHHDIYYHKGFVYALIAYNTHNAEIHPEKLLDEMIVQYDLQGNIVWQWRAQEHLEQLNLTVQEKQAIMERKPKNEMIFREWDFGIDWMHNNSIYVLEDNHHDQKGDKRFKPGNLLISSRELSTVFVIDYETKDIVFVLKGCEVGNGRIISQHHAKLLPNGNIMLYDNGGTAAYVDQTREFSRVVEIEPLTKKIVWEYRLPEFSPYCCSVQPLENGNILTMTRNSTNSTVLEVTREKEILLEIELPDQIYRAIAIKKGV